MSTNCHNWLFLAYPRALPWAGSGALAGLGIGDDREDFRVARGEYHRLPKLVVVSRISQGVALGYGSGALAGLGIGDNEQPL